MVSMTVSVVRCLLNTLFSSLFATNFFVAPWSFCDTVEHVFSSTNYCCRGFCDTVELVFSSTNYCCRGFCDTVELLFSSTNYCWRGFCFASLSSGLYNTTVKRDLCRGKRDLLCLSSGNTKILKVSTPPYLLCNVTVEGTFWEWGSFAWCLLHILKIKHPTLFTK
jgi:hypothetical protein